MIISGLTYHNNFLYILAVVDNNDKGFVWKCEFMKEIKQFIDPILIHVMRDSPCGICSIDDKLIISTDEIVNDYLLCYEIRDCE